MCHENQIKDLDKSKENHIEDDAEVNKIFARVSKGV
jgi:hypothetical protein